MKKIYLMTFLSLFYFLSASAAVGDKYEGESYNNTVFAVAKESINAGYIDAGEWIEYYNVSFVGTESKIDFRASVNLSAGSQIEIRLDAVDGTLIGTVDLTSDGGWSNYTTHTGTLSSTPTGTHNLFLVFVNGGLNLDNFQFKNAGDVAVGNLFQGESFDFASDAAVTKESVNAGYIDTGDWIEYDNVSFSGRELAVDIMTSGKFDGTIEFRLDALDGTLIGTVNLPKNGSFTNYHIVRGTLASTTGTHKLYLKFTAGGFNLDYFQFATSKTHYASPGGLKAVCDLCQNGDTVFMASGTYNNTGDRVDFPAEGINIVLTPNPSAATQPVFAVEMYNPLSHNGGGITFDGIDINRDGDNFFYTNVAYTMGSLKFKNCTIQHVNRRLIYANNSAASISAISLENCSITNCGSNGDPFIDSNLSNIGSFTLDNCKISSCGLSSSKNPMFLLQQTVGAVTVRNSTIQDVAGGNFIKLNTAAASGAITVLFENNTFHKSISWAGYSCFSVEGTGGYSSASTFTFRNNIFDKGYDGALLPRIFYTKIGDGTLTESNNLLNGYDGDYIQGTVASKVTRSNLSFGIAPIANVSSISYSDEANNNFTIASSSELATAGVDGKRVGDPRWINASASDYFRSKTSGNWSAVGSWQNSYDNTNWRNSDLIPTSSGASLSIQKGHLITVNENATAKGISVAPGGQLTLNSGVALAASSLTLSSDANGTASFVDNSASGLTVSGTTTVSQSLPTARNWYISSPVNSAAVPSSGYAFYSRNEVTASWETLNAGASLSPGKGYIANLASGSASYSFTGTLNTGNVDVSVTRTAGVNAEGYNLVGNPFASYIDWDNVAAASTNLKTSVWERTQNGNNAYVFDTYNSSGQVGTDNSGRGTNGNIAPMQAFWVQVADGQASGTVRFTNAMRAHKGSKAITGGTVNDPLFKTQSVQSPVLLRLQVSNGINTDETVIYTNAGASNAYDEYDSPKMMNNNASIAEIYTSADNQKLAINGLGFINSGSEFALGFNTLTANEFKLKATQLSNLDENLKIVLKDNITGAETELTEGGEYSFYSDVYSSDDRFSIQFKTTGTVTETARLLSGNIQAYSIGNSQIRIHCQNKASEKMTVQLYSALGKKIAEQSIISENTTLDVLGTGVYLVQISNKEGIKTTKVMVK